MVKVFNKKEENFWAVTSIEKDRHWMSYLPIERYQESNNKASE